MTPKWKCCGTTFKSAKELEAHRTDKHPQILSPDNLVVLPGGKKTGDPDGAITPQRVLEDLLSKISSVQNLVVMVQDENGRYYTCYNDMSVPNRSMLVHAVHIDFVSSFASYEHHE